MVLGWNPHSLARGLARGGSRLDEQGGLEVALGRFHEADARLAAAARMPAPTSGAPAPWSRMRAAGRTEPQGVRLRFELHAGPDA